MDILEYVLKILNSLEMRGCVGGVYLAIAPPISPPMADVIAPRTLTIMANSPMKMGVDAQLLLSVNNKCCAKGCFEVVVVFSGYIVTTTTS